MDYFDYQGNEFDATVRLEHRTYSDTPQTNCRVEVQGAREAVVLNVCKELYDSMIKGCDEAVIRQAPTAATEHQYDIDATIAKAFARFTIPEKPTSVAQ